MKHHIAVAVCLVALLLCGMGCSCKGGRTDGDKALLETPDLTLYELRGNVKHMKDENGKSHYFHADGTLQADDAVIERDKEGRIVKMKVRDIETAFKWDNESKLTERTRAGIRSSYWHDDRGLTICCVTEADTWEMSVYRYIEFDRNGNWIKRERLYRGVRSTTEDGEDATYKGLVAEKREIRYY